MELATVVQDNGIHNVSVDDVVVVGPTRLNTGTHFYYYHQTTRKFMGCMPIEVFKVIGEAALVPVMETPEEQEEMQMSLFD